MFKKRFLSVLLLLPCCALPPVWAQAPAAQPLSLQQCIAIAQQNQASDPDRSKCGDLGESRRDLEKECVFSAGVRAE